MSKIMFDSTNARDIPTTVDMVAGYIDGAYAWSQADWDRFPGIPQVRIATSALTNDGDVLDVERGDATPNQAPGWIRMRQAAGLLRPTIYCPASSVSDVTAYCWGLTFDFWTAEWTNQAHVTAGAVATQFATTPASGGHYDISQVVDDAWPHRQEEDDMWTDAEKAKALGELDNLQTAVGEMESRVANTLQPLMTNVQDLVGKVQALVNQLTTQEQNESNGGVDVNALAAAIVRVQGQKLSA